MKRDWRWEWQILVLDVRLFLTKVATAFHEMRTRRYERRCRLLEFDIALLKAQAKNNEACK